MRRDEFDEELARRGRDSADFLHLPGPDEGVNPEGRVVIERGVDDWTVLVQDRGPRHVTHFADEEAAYDFAFRRWVLWEVP